MATFKLTNINLQIDKPLFHSHTAKILKIEVAEPNSTPSIIKLPQPPQILNAQSLQWHATLSLPARFGKPFQFEIINKHAGYGYNPQDTETAFEGRIVINKSDGDYAGWEVTLDDQKIGFLFANIEVFSKLGSKQAITTIQSNKSAFFGNTIPVKKDHIAITSLYANFPQLSKIQKTRVFIEFQLSGSTSRSSIKRLHQAEYRSYETIQLPVVTAKNNKLVAAAFIFDSQGNATKKIGQGFTQLLIQSQNKESSSLAERLKIERIFLYNQNMEEVGWVSFKFLLTKDQLLDPKVFLQDHFNTIGDVNFRPLKNNSLTISQIRGTIPIMSGLESNSRVYVPKSQRFDDPSKRKACQKIGLGHVSLELKEYPSTHKYKVAGIGFGTKIVPVQRDTSIPGVGRYNLPLLFDRFK